MMMPGMERSSSDSIRPPRWAEAVLGLLVRSDEAESVSGDLIEEYRITVYPSRGRLRADVWYVRQVLGFMLRAPLICGLVLAALHCGRSLLDTFAPPVSWGPRSAVTTWSSIALFVFAGACGAWRTGRARSGILVALVTYAIGSTLGLAFDVALYVSVIRHDPVKLYMFQLTGGWDEELGLPFMLSLIVAVLGTFGGMLGKLLGAARPRTAA